MVSPELIGPVPRTTPAAWERVRGRRRALPDDLLREASHRLGIISLLGASLWIVGPLMGHLFGDMSHVPGGFQLMAPDAIAAGCVLTSLALFFYSRKPDRDPRFVLDVAGVFPPGRPLPPERKLCVEIGVSRTAVREALARLAQLRLIQLRQGGETLVLDFREVAGLDLLPRLLRGDGGLQADVLGAGLEMRAALAPEIARLAAVRGGPAVAAELDEVLAAMAQAPGDPAALHVLSLRFWAPVVAGSENLAFRLAFNSLRDAFAAIRDEVAAAMARELGDHAGYRAIAAAIRRRDGAGAARATRAHLALGAPGLAAMVARLERRPS